MGFRTLTARAHSGNTGLTGLAVVISVLVLSCFAGAARADTIYATPGPKPPVGTAACAAAPGAPCATKSTNCSHIVAPSLASDGDTIELRTDPATPCNAWAYDEVPGTAESTCYLPDNSGGGGGYVVPTGGEPLNVCKVKVDTGAGTIYHQNPNGTWEETAGPGWMKVGVDDICGNGCSPYEDEDENWMAVIPPPITTSACLKVTVIPGAAPYVKETFTGAVPQTASVSATVTNACSDTVENVTVQDPLTIQPILHKTGAPDLSGCAWAAAAGQVTAAAAAHPTSQCPIQQAAPLSNPNLGTLTAGQSATVTWPLTVRGDGDWNLYAEAGGTADDPTRGSIGVSAVGKAQYTPDSDLLVTSVAPGTRTVSPLSAALITAGTPFTYVLHVENRSFYRRLYVLPRITVGGNVVGGIVQASTDPIPANPPDAGTPNEVVPNPILELDPRQSKDFNVVFWSVRSDAIQTKPTVTGGTRGTVQFAAPPIATLDDSDQATGQDPGRVISADHSYDQVTLHFDDSQPKPVDYNYQTAGIAWSKGAFTAIWHLTTSFLHGTFVDLPTGLVSLARSVPSLLFKDVELESQLWHEVQGNPALEALYYNALTHQILFAFRYAPSLAMSAAQTYSTVSSVVGTELNRMYGEWRVGDWQGAIQDLSAETGDGAGQITSLIAGPAALTKTLALSGEMSVLSRLRPAIEALATTTAAETATGDALIAATGAERDVAAADKIATSVGEDAKSLGERATADEEAAKLLEEDKLPDGMELDPSNEADLKLVQAAFGVTPQEAEWYSSIAKIRRENLVARSRGVGAAERLEEGAYLKPYEMKAKNMSPLDGYLFNFPSNLSDLVVLDRDLPHAKLPLSEAKAAFEADLQARGLTPGTNAYVTSVERYETQWSQTNELLPKYEKWAKTTGHINGEGPVHGAVDLTWDATENPPPGAGDVKEGAGGKLNFKNLPDYDAKAKTPVRFRLKGYDSRGNPVRDPRNARYLVPEIKARGGHWGPITGDVDWLSFSDAEGNILTGDQQTELWSDLKVAGTQHPHSASWLNPKTGAFKFDAKLKFLSGKTVAQLEAPGGGLGKTTMLEFSADGKMRTVVLDYNASNFDSPETLKVVWRGGYRYAAP